eukprot:2294789-Prorocentrum_lima.AAC.1
MTSSLVGSEMCIRDSPSGAPGACPPWPSPAIGPPAHPHALTHHPLPVSYTHLTLPTICSV